VFDGAVLPFAEAGCGGGLFGVSTGDQAGVSDVSADEVPAGGGSLFAMVRPMEEDLGLPPGSYFPEEELPMIPTRARVHATRDCRSSGICIQWSSLSPTRDWPH